RKIILVVIWAGGYGLAQNLGSVPGTPEAHVDVTQESKVGAIVFGVHRNLLQRLQRLAVIVVLKICIREIVCCLVRRWIGRQGCLEMLDGCGIQPKARQENALTEKRAKN